METSSRGGDGFGDDDARGSVQKRLSDQRAKLLALEYHDPFTKESLALVERLFADLVTTTESYEDLTQREEQTAGELALSRAQLFPLKKENARLVRDNNLLHLKVIKAAEEASAAERSALLLSKRFETERGEATILGAQKDSRIADLETQVDDLRESLAKALANAEKDGRSRSSLRAGGGRLNGFQREMEMSTPLSTRAAEAVKRTAGRGFDADKLGPEDDRLSGIVEALRARLEEASESMEILAEEKARLSEQVSAREEEIKRLGKQLGSDGHVDQVTLARAHEANQRIVEQLNDQVDFLNKQLANRETQLKQAREEAERRASTPPHMELELGRLQALTRQLEEDNSRLVQRTAVLERQGDLGATVVGNAAAVAASAAGGTNGQAERETDDQDENDEEEKKVTYVRRLEREKEDLVEALSAAVRERDEARERVGQAEASLQEAVGESERLRRILGVVESTGDASMAGAGVALQDRDRAMSELKASQTEAVALQGEVARLKSEAETRSARIDVLLHERETLISKLKWNMTADGNAQASGSTVDDDYTRTGTTPRSSSGQRTVTFAEEQTDHDQSSGDTKSEQNSDREEFLQQDAAAARAQLAAAENRARSAEARSAEIARELDGVKRQLKEEEHRAMGAEGLAADARDEAGSARGIGAWRGAENVGDRIEALQRRLEESDAARKQLSEELERLAGQGSLLGVERSAQSARLEACDRERASLRQDLKAREQDVMALAEQKRSLEEELSRAQRTLSAGAVESASAAQGELMLRARIEEMSEEVRTLKGEVDSLRNNLLAEERKATAARDEADRLSARLSHRSLGLEGLEAEVASLRAELGVGRAKALERDGAYARSEAEAERLRVNVAALEQQLSATRESLSDRDQEIRRLKALARQLEGSRESLKASADQTHAALREAELRAGKAAATGDALSRDREASQAEVVQLRGALSELDADRDRLQDTLDNQTEQLASLREEVNHLRQSTAEAEDRLREEGSRCSDLEAALQEADARAKQAEEKAVESVRRMETASSELSNKRDQLAAATEDLEMMTKENQAVTADLTRLGAEKEDARRTLGDALHKAATAEQAARAAQFEKEDVLKNYRGLHAEKRRLEAGVDELQLARQRLTKSLAERDMEVSKLRGSCSALEVELQRKTMDIGASQRQAENLSQQLLRAGRRVEALASENRRLVADSRAQRHHANAMLERIRSQQGQSANAGQEVNSLRARLQALEEERDGLSHILGRERSHGTGLEQLIEASRLREASVAAEQRQMAREKERLETKAARLSEELAQARECLADLSSRVSVSSSHQGPLPLFAAPGTRSPANNDNTTHSHHINNNDSPAGSGNSPGALTDTSAAAAAAARATAAAWNRRIPAATGRRGSGSSGDGDVSRHIQDNTANTSASHGGIDEAGRGSPLGFSFDDSRFGSAVGAAATSGGGREGTRVAGRGGGGSGGRGEVSMASSGRSFSNFVMSADGGEDGVVVGDTDGNNDSALSGRQEQDGEEEEKTNSQRWEHPRVVAAAAAASLRRSGGNPRDGGGVGGVGSGQWRGNFDDTGVGDVREGGGVRRGAQAAVGGDGGENQQEEDSGVFDLEDVRGFVRRESQRLRDSVRGSGGGQAGRRAKQG